MKTFKIGDKVQRMAFTDCFGRDIPCSGELTVTETKIFTGEGLKVKLTKPFPAYQRVTATGESGTFEGAARFFI